MKKIRGPVAEEELGDRDRQLRDELVLIRIVLSELLSTNEIVQCQKAELSYAMLC